MADSFSMYKGEYKLIKVTVPELDNSTLVSAAVFTLKKDGVELVVKTLADNEVSATDNPDDPPGGIIVTSSLLPDDTEDLDHGLYDFWFRVTDINNHPEYVVVGLVLIKDV